MELAGLTVAGAIVGGRDDITGVAGATRSASVEGIGDEGGDDTRDDGTADDGTGDDGTGDDGGVDCQALRIREPTRSVLLAGMTWGARPAPQRRRAAP